MAKRWVTRMLRAVGLAAIVLVTGVPTAFAGPMPPVSGMTPEALFQKFDLDHDGVVTEAEFVGVRLQIFHDMDTDRDGAVSRDEYEANVPPDMPRQARQKMFEHLDHDSNGRLSEFELEMGARQVFNGLARRHDRRVILQDFADFPHAPMLVLVGSMHGPRHAPTGPQPAENRRGPMRMSK